MEKTETLSETIGFTPGEDNWLVVHEMSREYGGPEEGGWYYDAGEVEVNLPLHDLDDDEVFALYNLALKMFPQTKSRFSVAPRERDFNLTFSETRGEDYPETRPHYE